MTTDPAASDPAAARALSAALEMARAELPSAGLGARIVGQTEYRELLARELLRPAPQPWLPVLGLIASAAAAALLIPWQATPPPIAAELRVRSQPAAASSSDTERHDACLVRRVAQGLAPGIDDFEDADDAVLPHEGRAGLWRWVRDTDAPRSAPAALPIPRPGGTQKNRLALRAKGGPLLDWGAALEFTFNPACYDASRYRGIAFEARGPGRIYFSPRQSSVIPRSEGGTCESDCHNPHVAKIELAKKWRTFEVRWADVRQRGSGMPALDPTRLHSVAFLIRAEDTPYDVWLDDVRFIP